MNFRIPADLKDRLEKAAAEAGRSLTAEMVQRLQQSFNVEPLTEAKRTELIALVNAAIDERLGTERSLPDLDAAAHIRGSDGRALYERGPDGTLRNAPGAEEEVVDLGGFGGHAKPGIKRRESPQQPPRKSARKKP